MADGAYPIKRIRLINFHNFVDETIELFDEISVSAGARGTQIVLSPLDYILAAKATVTDLTKAVHPEEHAR